MAFPTFDPLQLPTANSGGTEANVRLIELKFGEGYRQTFKDGLNAVERSTTLNWAACTYATADYIDAFLEANAGKVFYYRLPGALVIRKWDCKTWKVDPITGREVNAQGVPTGLGLCRVSAQLRERFDNAT